MKLTERSSHPGWNMQSKEPIPTESSETKASHQANLVLDKAEYIVNPITSMPGIAAQADAPKTITKSNNKEPLQMISSSPNGAKRFPCVSMVHDLIRSSSISIPMLEPTVSGAVGFFRMSKSSTYSFNFTLASEICGRKTFFE